MTSEEIIEHTKRIIKHVIDCPDKTSNYKGVLAQALEFLHRYAGPKSSFFTMAQGCGGSPGFAKESLISVGSSAESVGSLGCRQVAKCMIQCYF